MHTIKLYCGNNLVHDLVLRSEYDVGRFEAVELPAVIEYDNNIYLLSPNVYIGGNCTTSIYKLIEPVHINKLL